MPVPFLLFVAVLSFFEPWGASVHAQPYGRPPGGHPPGTGRAEVLQEFNQLVLSLVDQVIQKTQSQAPDPGSDLARWREELGRCSLYRVEHMLPCLQQNSRGVIDAAFSKPTEPGFGRRCQASEKTTIWSGTGDWAAVPGRAASCSEGIATGETYEIIDPVRRRHLGYRQYFEGYKVRVTSGRCRGAEGYVIYVRVDSDCR